MTKKEREKRVDALLNRGVLVEILPTKKAFRKKLIEEKMKVYIGADPTSTALHLSHAKNYMLLEEFRLLGHEVYVLFGDFTARIGDPTDKVAARKQLTREEVVKNVQGWINQIKPLMDFDAKVNPPKIVYNSDWLGKLTMEDVINLSANVTVQQLLERDMFAKRVKEKKPIYLHEFMYPIMQGYDSVALEVDVELCGTDQIFNALVGRTLLRKLKGMNKFVAAVNLMENPKTNELMSKSRGTGVFLDSTPFNMYGAIMSQPDEMIEIFLINNTRISLAEVSSVVEKKGPRDAKMFTAFEIVKIFYGEEEAKRAQDKFIRLVQNKESADDIPEINIGSDKHTLFEVLRKCYDKGTSNSAIRRLIKQKAVKLNGEANVNEDSLIIIPKTGINIKVGKKKWFKIIA